jgi:nucleotide-binding universal stress UspA family protein
MSNSAPSYQRILIAVDDSDCSKKALKHALMLARNMQSHLGLVHVTEPVTPANYGADPLLGQQAILIPETNLIQEANGQALLDQIKNSLSEFSSVQTFNRLGVPRQEILAVADEWQADLIVMGTHGRTGFDHFISGSVSESVLRRAQCPVLVVPGKCE